MEGRYTLLVVLLAIFATTTIILVAYMAYKACARLRKVVDEEGRHNSPKASTKVPTATGRKRSSMSSWSTWKWNRSYDTMGRLEKDTVASYPSPHAHLRSAPPTSSPIHDVPSSFHRWFVPSPLPKTPNKRPASGSPGRRLLDSNTSNDSFSEVDLHPNGTPVVYLSMPPALRARSPSPAFASLMSPTSPERMAQMQRDPKLSPVQGPVRPMSYFKSL